MMKNIAFSEVLTLKDQIQYQQGQVVSRTLVQNNAVSVTLFSFDTEWLFRPFRLFCSKI